MRDLQAWLDTDCKKSATWLLRLMDALNDFRQGMTTTQARYWTKTRFIEELTKLGYLVSRDEKSGNVYILGLVLRYPRETVNNDAVDNDTIGSNPNGLIV